MVPYSFFCHESVIRVGQCHFQKHDIIKYRLYCCFDFNILGFTVINFYQRDIAFKIIPTAMASPCNKVVLFYSQENNFQSHVPMYDRSSMISNIFSVGS
jgi:hypothetical protein